MKTQEALECIDDSIETMKMANKECEKVQDSIPSGLSDDSRIVVAMLMRNQVVVANIFFALIQTVLTNQDELKKELAALDIKRLG